MSALKMQAAAVYYSKLDIYLQKLDIHLAGGGGQQTLDGQLCRAKLRTIDAAWNPSFRLPPGPYGFVSADSCYALFSVWKSDFYCIRCFKIFVIGESFKWHT